MQHFKLFFFVFGRKKKKGDTESEQSRCVPFIYISVRFFCFRPRGRFKKIPTIQFPAESPRPFRNYCGAKFS